MVKRPKGRLGDVKSPLAHDCEVAGFLGQTNSPRVLLSRAWWSQGTQLEVATTSTKRSRPTSAPQRLFSENAAEPSSTATFLGRPRPWSRARNACTASTALRPSAKSPHWCGSQRSRMCGSQWLRAGPNSRTYFSAHPETGRAVAFNLASVIGQRLQIFQAMWLREVQRMVEQRYA